MSEDKNEKKKIPSRYNWIFKDLGSCNFDILEDKRSIIAMYYADGLKKLLTMFKYTTIPKTISPRTIELFVLDGYAKIFRFNENWYCAVGSMSGVLTSDYLPLSSTLTNTYLNYSKTLENVTELNKDDITKDNIEKYCFIIPNDDLFFGVNSALSHYARLQTECDLTIKTILYNMRVPMIAIANDDPTKTAFDNYMKSIANGDISTALNGTKLFDALKGVPYNNQHLGMLKEVIECKQYLKASFENSIGLNANYNMKRESLNNDEIALNDDNLLPNVDEMKRCRENGYEIINYVSQKLFNEKVFEFDLYSAWKNRQKEIQLEFEQQKTEVQNDNVQDEPKEEKEVTENV